jgi:hypothetical protein
MQQTTADYRPWHRQGWPWFLIALPTSAVIGGIVTLILALNSPNALVVDDYYKEGLAINQQKERLATADRMGLSGLVRSNGKQLTLSLTSQPTVNEPTLALKIIHSTRADLDREVTLRRLPDGTYAADLPMLPAGSWYFHLRSGDASWQIRARITTDGGPFQARLTPGD